MELLFLHVLPILNAYAAYMIFSWMGYTSVARSISNSCILFTAIRMGTIFHLCFAYFLESQRKFRLDVFHLSSICVSIFFNQQTYMFISKKGWLTWWKIFFPSIIVNCCRFHLGQAWWRKIQKGGLGQEYKVGESEVGKGWREYLV